MVPVGAEKPEPIDVRLICATNLGPRAAGRRNPFRQDLLYRINTVEITLPPLRERREDIPLLLAALRRPLFPEIQSSRQAAVGAL